MNNFAVVQSGGCIGESELYGRYKGLKIVKMDLTKDQAKQYVKKLRSRLSKMDKQYYRIRYKTVEITK